MKSGLLSFLTAFLPTFLIAQTNLITNGSFENSTSPWTGWNSSIANGNLWAGAGSCGGSQGTDYAWCGDQLENTGINNLSEDMYQTVSIPSNTTTAVLYFDASINTAESGGGVYDQMEIQVQNTSGSVLTSLGALNNTHGDFGVSGCQTWDGYYVNIPSTYNGQTVRIVFIFSTDSSNPTIFRMDDVQLLVTTSNCSYALSTSSYTLTNNLAGTFNNVASVTADNGCAWTANVTAGATWLSSASSGSGNGSINITVTENTSGSLRTGTIEVAGYTLTINQPALVCDYTISPEIYICPDYHSGTLNNIAIINTSDGCVWDADVLEGSSWLVTNSNGSGSGTINITVLENNSATPRSGSVIVEGETLLVEQPANHWLTGFNDPMSTGIRLYPNPASGIISIQVEENMSAAQFDIIDLSGRIVMTDRMNGKTINLDVAALLAGMYSIRFTTDIEVRNQTFIKTNE